MTNFNFFEAGVNMFNGKEYEYIYIQGYLPCNVNIRNFIKKTYGAVCFLMINDPEVHHYGGIMVNKEDNEVLFKSHRANLWEWNQSYGWSSNRQPKF